MPKNHSQNEGSEDGAQDAQRMRADSPVKPAQDPQNLNSEETPAPEPLWTRDFFSVVLFNFFLFCGFNMLPTLLPLHFHDLGAPDALIGLVAGVWMVSCILMRPFVGMAIDRFGRRGILTAGFAVMALSCRHY